MTVDLRAPRRRHRHNRDRCRAARMAEPWNSRGAVLSKFRLVEQQMQSRLSPLRTCHYIGLASNGPKLASHAVKRSCGRYFSYTQSSNDRRGRAEPQNDCSPRGATTDLAPTVRLLHGRPLRLHNASRRPSKESSAMHAIRKLRESGHATVADYEKLTGRGNVGPILFRRVYAFFSIFCESSG